MTSLPVWTKPRVLMFARSESTAGLLAAAINNARGLHHSLEDDGVGPRHKRSQDDRLAIVGWLERCAFDLRFLRVLPIIVRSNQGAVRCMQFDQRILQERGCRQTGADQRWPEASQHHRLGQISSNDKPADCDLVAHIHAQPGGDVQGLGRRGRRCRGRTGGRCRRSCGSGCWRRRGRGRRSRGRRGVTTLWPPASEPLLILKFVSPL